MIATEKDILGKLSEIMVRPDPDGKNLSSICRAAELLGKYYGLFDGTYRLMEQGKAIIIDDLDYQAYLDKQIDQDYQAYLDEMDYLDSSVTSDNPN